MKTVFSIFFFFFASSGLSFNFQVVGTEGPGIDSTTLQTTTALVESAVNSMQRHHTSGPKEAQFQLKARLLKLGETYLFSLEKQKDHNPVLAKHMRAERLEDLDTVVNRVVRAVISESSPESEVRVDDVTEAEALTIRRRRATGAWFLGFGPHGGHNLTSALLVNFSVGYNWFVGPAAVKIYTDSAIATSGQSARLFQFGIGASYYFTRSDISPLVAAEFGYGFSSGASGSSNGFAGGLGTGIGLFRTSTIGLEILARVSAIFTSNESGIPTIYGFRASLYF
ncbi:MAG: hypothetical protein HY537_16335 [Deltaproteobacteria bacterium]|nr:hypothetical protein [Deltaproteobacteria bacterium]